MKPKEWYEGRDAYRAGAPRQTSYKGVAALNWLAGWDAAAAFERSMASVWIGKG